MKMKVITCVIATFFTCTVSAFPFLEGSASLSHFRDAQRRPRYDLDFEVLAIVDETQLVPDGDHPFQAPGPGDQRGPCPGMNTLANHGYIPRSGIVSQEDVISGTAAGFNMGADLAEFLAILSVAYNGDLITELFSIGGPDSRTEALPALQNILGYEGGLNYHGAVIEGDTSSTRKDEYFGDDHSMDPDLYIQMKDTAANYAGLYTIAAMNDLQEIRYHQSLLTNPTFYFVPLEGPHVTAGKSFVPQFFSNGTYGSGGVPNEVSISSFHGAELQSDGSYKYVPERFPQNWYRRNVSYGLVDALADILYTLQTKTLPFGANGGTVDEFIPLDIVALTNVTGLACVMKDAIQTNVPSMVAGPVRDVEQLINDLAGKLDPLFGDFGCPPYKTNQTQAYGAVNKWYNSGSSY